MRASPTKCDILHKKSNLCSSYDLTHFLLQGYVENIIEDEFDDETLYVVRTAGSGEKVRVDSDDIVPFDFDNDVPPTKNNAIPYGSMVLADGLEEDVNERYFHKAQITGMHKDGRYKIYYLSEGSVAYLKANEVATMPHGSFQSPSDAKMFSSCDEFFDLIKGKKSRSNFRKEIGDGCFVVLSWPRKNGRITTLLATYDGQIHIEFNVYSSVDIYEEKRENSLITNLAENGIAGTDQKQTDLFPRGYGRVVNFREDLEKPYFGTKYPEAIKEIT